MNAPPDSVRGRSIIALKELLIEVVARSGAYVNAPIANHLKSQGALASFSDSDHRIVGGSLNTLKRSCLLVEGGFPALDRLRKCALAAIKNHTSSLEHPPKTAKAALAGRAERAELELQTAREDLLLLSFLLERSLHQGKLYATDSKNAAIEARCSKEQSELRDMTTLRRSSTGQFKVVRGST
ncbi:hypothetical protein [Variovorax paradoxus]|jgi:hypothetical protein|uniref:hypothetical protein n=1 Tax=Variovorax paradoxus TaxID=34073 RepID=UPI0012DAC23C|nr:hypothetical protein [Variovorax paradoxus]